MASSIPWLYRLFFLYIEPVATLAGFYYAFFFPAEYLELTVPASTTALHSVSQREEIVLRQLANLYLAFALNEAIVLRATADRRVWAALLAGLLLADFGHLYSVAPRGAAIYWSFASWNAMDWGNLGFVYVGASMRIAFLSGVGLGGKTGAAKVKR